MSDETLSQDSAEAPGASAGQLLRKAREAKGLHIAALAVSMKVPVKKLEALEADRLQDLPDAVFVRALAASMCRTLKVDPAPILSRLPQSTAPKFEMDDRGVNASFRSPEYRSAITPAELLKKPAVLVVLALLLAALVVVMVPDTVLHPAGAPQPAAAEAAGQSPGTPEAVPVANPQIRPTASEPTGSIATPPVAPVATERASQPAAAVAVPAASAPANAVMRFQAKAAAWVRVTDSTGAVQLEKTLVAGESASAGGALPLAVTVGNVGATEVEVRGQAFPLDIFNKNNVARFEVK